MVNVPLVDVHNQEIRAPALKCCGAFAEPEAQREQNLSLAHGSERRTIV